MNINTEDWLPVAEAARLAGMSDVVARRLTRDLGLSQTIFGVLVMKLDDLPKMVQKRRRRGNQRWIADGDAAAADSLKATAARMERIKATKPRAAKRGATK
jgi:hypothetical protein